MVACALLGGCRERADPKIESVSLDAADGVRLAARIFRPRADSPPGLILVHRLGADHAAWDPFAYQAQLAGYMAISLDLRGHGESRGNATTPLDYRTFKDPDWQDTLLDIDAARQRLLAEGADPENLFIAGEALGASLALQYAVGHPDIQGAILVSPGLEYKGIDAGALIAQFAKRPTLLLWAEGDAYATASGSALERLAPGHIEVHRYAGAAHGANLFSASPQSMGQILVWLNQMLSAKS